MQTWLLNHAMNNVQESVLDIRCGTKLQAILSYPHNIVQEERTISTVSGAWSYASVIHVSMCASLNEQSVSLSVDAPARFAL